MCLLCTCKGDDPKTMYLPGEAENIRKERCAPVNKGWSPHASDNCQCSPEESKTGTSNERGASQCKPKGWGIGKPFLPFPNSLFYSYASFQFSGWCSACLRSLKIIYRNDLSSRINIWLLALLGSSFSFRNWHKRFPEEKHEDITHNLINVKATQANGQNLN